MRLPITVAALLLSSLAWADDDPSASEEAPTAEDYVSAGVSGTGVVGQSDSARVFSGATVGWRHSWAAANAPILAVDLTAWCGNERGCWGRALVGADVLLVGQVDQGVLIGPRAGVFGGEEVKPRIEVGLSAMGSVRITPDMHVGITATGMLYDADGDGNLESTTLGVGLVLGANTRRNRTLQSGSIAVAPIVAEPIRYGAISPVPRQPRQVTTPSTYTWRTVYGLSRGSAVPRVHPDLGERLRHTNASCDFGERGFRYPARSVTVCVGASGGARSVELRSQGAFTHDGVEPLGAVVGWTEADLIVRLGQPDSRLDGGRLLYDRGRIQIDVHAGQVRSVFVAL